MNEPTITVLIVDDAVGNGKLLARVLSNYINTTHNIVIKSLIASNCGEALTQFENEEGKVDLFMLDYDLGGLCSNNDCCKNAVPTLSYFETSGTKPAHTNHTGVELALKLNESAKKYTSDKKLKFVLITSLHGSNDKNKEQDDLSNYLQKTNTGVEITFVDKDERVKDPVLQEIISEIVKEKEKAPSGDGGGKSRRKRKYRRKTQRKRKYRRKTQHK